MALLVDEHGERVHLVRNRESIYRTCNSFPTVRYLERGFRPG